jgi:lysophospholipase L1-like esterase
MPLGDSITDGFNIPGGYRIELARGLTAGCVPFDFVGSQSNGPASLSDRDHEGHSGWRIDEIAARVRGWLEHYRPRIVLLMVGTNDLVQDHRIATAPARLDALIGTIAGRSPPPSVLVASLPPLADRADSAAARTFNRAIAGIVEARARNGYDVRFVDLHAGLSTRDLADGVHPNAAGYAKLASGWNTAIRKGLRCSKGRCPASSCRPPA